MPCAVARGDRRDLKMKNETIFNFRSTWFGRYGDEEGYEITVSAEFTNPAVWPFTVKKFDITYDDDFNEKKEETVSARISKGAFDKIKSVIAGNTSLRYDSDEIDAEVMDGSSDEFFFACDEYPRTLGGSSVLSIGSYEADECPPEKRTIAYTIHTVFNEIESILKSEGVDLWA